jgi:hypothetical protein
MLSIDPQNYPNDPSQATEDISPTERFWLFAEHTLTLLAVSAILGLLTVFIDARWFILLVGVFLLGMHRSKALKGMSLVAQIFTYLGLGVFAALLLWPMGRLVNESRDEAVNLVNQVIQRQNSEPALQRTEAPAPAPPFSVTNRQSPALPKFPDTRDIEAFNIERPVLAITKKYPGPTVPLDRKIKWAGFQMEVENRGRTLAQNTELYGKMTFPDRHTAGGWTLTEMIKSQCQGLPIDPKAIGPSIPPTIGPEPKVLTGWAETDFEGVQRQLLDTAPNVGGTLWGFFVGCVVYHSDLSNRTLHTKFVYMIAFVPTTPTARQQVKDFQNHVDSVPDLNVEEVNFAPLPEYSVSD